MEVYELAGVLYHPTQHEGCAVEGYELVGGLYHPT